MKSIKAVMKKATIFFTVLFVSTIYDVVAFAQPRASVEEPYLSPVALAADSDGGTLYIAETTGRQIAVFDVATETVVRTFAMTEQPSGLALARDNSRLYVTGASPSGKVVVFDLNKGKLVGSIKAGHTPTGPVLSPDGNKLYVCNQFDNNISVIDLVGMAEVAKVPVMREPVGAVITSDGKNLFVANLLPAGVADGDYVAAVVSVIETVTNKVRVNIQLPNGSTDVRGICVSPDGRYVYVTHILARYQLPTTQLERGWMNTNALSVIDVKSEKLLNTVLLDDVHLGAANPWGVACSGDGKYICVAHAGTHEISVIDREGLHDKLTMAAAGNKVSDVISSPGDVPNDLSFLFGLRWRIKLTGNGPRGLAIVGTKAYVAEYFSDSLAIVNVDSKARCRARSLLPGPQNPMTAVRKGEMLFNDATTCFQQWQSCASCHPGDGRLDGLNWDLLNDGIGNPKNTKSLLLSHKTPPAMISGIRENAEDAVRSGFRHILLSVCPEDDAAAIDEYLKSLEPVTSPYRVDHHLSPAAERGQKIFAEAGCASCHSGPLYTDLQKYDIGTGKGLNQNQAFDTPTLVEVWRTAPYLYDGRAATIEEVLTKYNQNDRHGVTSKLTAEQIADLAEFVLSQ